MRTTVVAIALSLGLAASAAAQDGGKVPWKKDPKAAMEEAKKSGKAMMLFFTSEG